MRLIDADAFEKTTRERYCKDCVHRKGMKNGKMRVLYQIGDAPCRACEVDDVLSYLDDAPTVDCINRKDAIRVIRQNVMMSQQIVDELNRLKIK